MEWVTFFKLKESTNLPRIFRAAPLAFLHGTFLPCLHHDHGRQLFYSQPELPVTPALLKKAIAVGAAHVEAGHVLSCRR
jgi:hypothetical protein